MASRRRKDAMRFSAAGPAILIVVLLSVAGAARADVEISTKPTQNMTCSGGVCTPTAQKAVLNVGDLANMLAGADVKISSGSLAQDIEIDAALSWTSASRLALDAYRSLTVDKPVEIAGAGSLTIKTNDGGTGGDYRFVKKGHVDFWDEHTGHLTINGQSFGLAKGLRKLESRLSDHGYVALARDYNAAKDGTYSHAIVTGGGGHFEGLGNTISNLSIADSTDREVGLFSEIFSTDFWIRDLHLEHVSVVGTGNTQTIGALVGSSIGMITNCSVTGQVLGSTNSFVGGLIGGSGGTITQASSIASVSASASSSTGGLIGINGGAVDQSFATGAVSGGDGSKVGGLVGWNDGDDNGAGIESSYATGVVTGASNAFVGGLIGSMSGPNAGSRYSYSTGTVSGGSGAILGGFVGNDTNTSGFDADNYWDMDTSGVSNPAQGAGNVQNDPGITGLTDAQLKSQLPTGFDPAIWGQSTNTNNGYPYLLSNLPQ